VSPGAAPHLPCTYAGVSTTAQINAALALVPSSCYSLSALRALNYVPWTRCSALHTAQSARTTIFQGKYWTGTLSRQGLSVPAQGKQELGRGLWDLALCK